MAEASAVKQCSVCGIDLTGKPRSKDAEGRYVCAECFQKARETKHTLENPPKPKQKAAAVPKPSDDDNSFILDIGGKALGTKGGKPCANCGRVLSEDTVICISCGYNTQSGKQLQIKVQKVKK